MGDAPDRRLDDEELLDQGDDDPEETDEEIDAAIIDAYGGPDDGGDSA